MLFDRRSFLKFVLGGTAAASAWGKPHPQVARKVLQNSLFSVTEVPDFPFTVDGHPNYHLGFEGLIRLMGRGGLKLYRLPAEDLLGGPLGLIARDDVVLIKINAQWKYRGATNSDLIRGIVQRILDFPGGFDGEVVLFENGQGRGSLNCDQTAPVYAEPGVRANAYDQNHSFRYIVDQVFNDPRVSAVLLDDYRSHFIAADNHWDTGYRNFESVSYPCFTTKRGTRVELRDGVWTGAGYAQNLKLINVPVLKDHDGSQFTGAIKHFYGVLSMSDGSASGRHYQTLGETCGTMIGRVRTPVLNVLDAIWVSNRSVAGYPESATTKISRVAASQDPLALDYWACKNILFPIRLNGKHHPENELITAWMTPAGQTINARGSLYNPARGILIDQVTTQEDRMLVVENRAADAALLDGFPPSAPPRRIK